MSRIILFLAVVSLLLQNELVLADETYTNEWVVHIVDGEKMANQVAKELGYENNGPLAKLGELKDYYNFVHKDEPARSKRSADQRTKRLSDDIRIRWVEQQVTKIRTKRRSLNYVREDRGKIQQINDPDWDEEWYLRDLSTKKRDGTIHMDLEVIPVWNKGLTGKGVVVTVLDDGLEHNHTDIHQNYDPKASYDMNDNDPDPFPRYDVTNENRHGTRCAGEIAMVAGNGKCGVGVAFNARIGGVRMLDGKVTDSLEARALSHAVHHIDIYSASWGPNDDGKTMEGPGILASKAFETGITQGRGGLGAIYAWASGNGGRRMDDCDCDGYTASIYTLSISSVSQHQQSPWYAERCASTMAATYSSGSYTDRKVVSTDLHDGCTDEHTGTSAAAPLGAGIFALVLEANPRLTWRDMQHLVVWTSSVAPLVLQNCGWKKNAAGFWINSAFGFGLLSADKLVNMADPKTWKSVPKKSQCLVEAEQGSLPRRLSSGKTVTIELSSNGCKGQSNEVNYIEHVQVVIDATYSNRGALEVILISPRGMTTQLLSKRDNDQSTKGITNWPFMSVHNWGENTAGKWTVKVMDDGKGNNEGILKSVSIRFHGTKEPSHVLKTHGRRKYKDVKNVKKCTKQSIATEQAELKKESMRKLKLAIAKKKKVPTATLR